MKSKCLVADSAAFLRHCNLRKFSEQVYTCEDVIAEIKDSFTRQRLQVLPYQLKVMQSREIDPKFMKKVVEVAKATGDYASLSVTDLKVLALTYQLQCQFDVDPMQDQEGIVKDQVQVGRKSGELDPEIPGFYIPSSGNKNASTENTDEAADKDVKELSEKLVSASIDAAVNDLKSCNDAEGSESALNNANGDSNDCNDLEEDPDEAVIDDEDDDDADAWITPAKLREMEEKAEHEKTVVCLTTDFSMQNVLFKMKLNVVSVDGLLIKSVRSYLLRCFGCFKTTKDMSKKFCPSCGHDTLKRVPYKLQEDGSIKMFLSRNPKVLSKRGKKFSLPTPQGGKHSMNPILCEDQRIPPNHAPKKSLAKMNAWSENYETNSSPFAAHDVYSQAFRLGVNRFNQRPRRNRNPNAVNQKFVKRR